MEWRVIDKVPERGDLVTPRDRIELFRVRYWDHRLPGPKIVLVPEGGGDKVTVWPDEVEVVEVVR